MGTVDKYKGFTLFWDSEAASREHIHIRDNQGQRCGKVWLEANGETKVEVFKLELPPHLRSALLKYIKKHAEEYREAWKEAHHGQ